MRSSNPLQRESVYENARTLDLTSHSMSVLGTANKLFFLSLVMIAGALLTYYQFSLGHMDYVNMLMTGGIIAGFILAIILAFKPDATPYLSPLYALSQGAVISGASCFFEARYPGIVIQAMSLTMLTVLVMAVLFSTKLIRATEKFRSIVVAASITIFVFYLISFILMMFGINVPYFTQNTPLNIGINIVVAGIAACYLILDFDFIQKGVEKGVPAVYEWYGAFSLLVTVVWLYIEILRLLSRLRSK